MENSVLRAARRFGLLALAAVALAVLLVRPALLAQVRYANVVCIIVSLFVGRSFIREEDVRGWMLQNAALLAHTAVLLLGGMMG